MELTKHATERMQQRGIPPLIVNACYEHGTQQHAGRGAIIYHLDRKAKRHLEQIWGRSVEHGWRYLKSARWGGQG